MKLARRRFLHLAAGAVALPAVSRIAWAQAYPTRPITMIVPFAAGGPTDVIGRVLAERMRRSLGQPVVIENVTGADGSIGTGRAARARTIWPGPTSVPGRHGRSWGQAPATRRAPGSRPTPPRAEHTGPPDGPREEPIGAATGASGPLTVLGSLLPGGRS
jgi:Tripartite tricarboxylate transporter family receptor